MKINYKNFFGEKIYSVLKNMELDLEYIKKSLHTSQNARYTLTEEEKTIKEIVAFLNTKNGSGGFVKIEKVTKEEIIEDFKSAGYDTVIFDTDDGSYDKIAELQKYYKSGEVICTYNNLKGRMRDYHMVVAIKNNIDNIKRSTTPKRDDEYGTSILNIQLRKNGKYMSIKNRYNHTVPSCDATLGNNLDRVKPGLQKKLLNYFNFAKIENSDQPDGCVYQNGILMRYNYELNNVYFGTFVLTGGEVKYDDTSRYLVVDYFVLDFQEKKCLNPASIEDCAFQIFEEALKEGTLEIEKI